MRVLARFDENAQTRRLQRMKDQAWDLLDSPSVLVRAMAASLIQKIDDALTDHVVTEVRGD